MVTRGIRRFVSRDWDAVRENKDRYWAARIARLGPLEGLRMAEELRRQALLLDASWPGESARQSDLASHIRVASLLRRAGSARGR